MINFNVYKINRDLAFTAEIDCLENEAYSSKLCEAVEWAKNNKTDLTHLDLSNGDFRGVELSYLNLNGSDFSYSDFTEAKLYNCDLRGANFNYAQIQDGVLLGSNFSDASFKCTNLTGAECLDSVFISCRFESAILKVTDFHCSNLTKASICDCEIQDIDLTGAIVTQLDLDVPRWVPRINNIHQKIAVAVEDGENLDMTQWHCGTSHCLAGWAVTLAGDDGQTLEGLIGTRAAAYSIFLQNDPDLTEMPNFNASDEEALQGIKERAAREAMENA